MDRQFAIKCTHCMLPIERPDLFWLHVGTGVRNCMRRMGGRKRRDGSERPWVKSKYLAEPWLSPQERIVYDVLLPWEWRSKKEISIRSERKPESVARTLRSLMSKTLVEKRIEAHTHVHYRIRTPS